MNKLMPVVAAAIAWLTLALPGTLAAQTTFHYRYDAANRLIGVVYANGQTLDFAYDNNGNLTAVTQAGNVPAGPVINVQPAYYPVGVGDTLILAVTATGDGLEFQWYKDGVLLVGETNATLVLAGLDAADAGRYHCVVTDAFGRSVASDAVHVQVLTDSVTNLWKSALKLAPGSRFFVYAFEVPTVRGSFTAKPKLAAVTIQPVNGKQVKAKPVLVSSPGVNNPLDALECAWPGKAVCLYDRKAFSAYYKQGLGCPEFLADHPIASTLVFVSVQDGKNVPAILSRFFNLVPPRITGLRDLADNPLAALGAGDAFRIVGTHFGEKAPKAWVEYVSGKGVRGKLAIKLGKELPFVGVGGKPSCMDPDTGESGLTATMPASFPADMRLGQTYHLIIDNGQGLAAIPFVLD